MRLGLGPVFEYEWLTSSRRRQMYAARSAVVAAMLLGMTTIWWAFVATKELTSIRAQAQVGEYYFYALIGCELALVMLAAPAAAAGAVCVERSRGTLSHILTTDLSSAEIVLGKLAARLLPVLGLVLGSWPVMALGSLLGGLDPVALAAAVAVTLAVAVLGCAAALALSVWAKKPHEVIMAVYTAWAVVMLAYPIWLSVAKGFKVAPPPRWVLLADPFYLALARYIEPSAIVAEEYFVFLGVTLGASLVLAALAVWRLRPASTRESGRPARRAEEFGTLGKLARALPGPSLDGSPVLWREWHRSRPSRWTMLLLVVIFGPTGFGCAWGASDAWTNGMTYGGPCVASIFGVYGFMIQILFGLLMLSAVAPLALSEERQRGSLDVLMATPLSTRSIVTAKWWGTFRMVPLLTIGPGLMALALATAERAGWATTIPAAQRQFYTIPLLSHRLFAAFLLVATVLAHGAAATSIGLALAARVARQGRAVAIGVGLFVLVCVGWPIAVMAISDGQGGLDSAAVGLATLSPVFASGMLVDMLTTNIAGRGNVRNWVLAWAIAEGLLAFIVLEWTVRTFDARMGRMPDSNLVDTSAMRPAPPVPAGSIPRVARPDPA